MFSANHMHFSKNHKNGGANITVKNCFMHGRCVNEIENLKRISTNEKDLLHNDFISINT